MRSRIEGGANDWDVVLVSADELLAGCDDGLFEKLNWAALGGKDHYLPAGRQRLRRRSRRAQPGARLGPRQVSATPSWADFWDVARYPGKRGLRRGARSNLEIALLADGVAPGDVYRLLRTDDGVDRAFRKLDQIKPYLVWWTPDAPAARCSARARCCCPAPTASRHGWPTGRAAPFRPAMGRQPVHRAVLGRDEGQPEPGRRAQAAGLLRRPGAPGVFATDIPYGPLAKGATDLLPPDVLAVSPTRPANLAAALQVDEQFWRDNGDKLNQRFDAWLAH